MTLLKPLTLVDCKLQRTDSSNVLSGSVDGIELYFKTGPEQDLVYSAEPFIAAMLMPAMARGCDIAIPNELVASPQFLAGIDQLQSIFVLWYPQLKRIAIDASVGQVPMNPRTGCALFFSGGLDACYGLQKNAHLVTHLVYARGIDMQLDDEPLYEQCLAANQQIADEFAKTLVAIESNVRFFMRQLSGGEIGWSKAQGCGLGSIALALGFPQVLISSSNTYDHLHPCGSHPLTDPLCSSAQINIVHDGCEARRHEKLLHVSQNEFLLQRIRVCWQDKGLNCGKCDKCLHYRMALTVCGFHVSNFARLTDYSELSGAHVNTHGEYVEWEDNLILAKKMNHKAASKAIDKLLRRYNFKQIVKLTDKVFLRGKLFSKKARQYS
jgi:hypothetical protein